MPIQDEQQRRREQDAIDAARDKEREAEQQRAAQSAPTADAKADKLLPILNATRDRCTSKIESLNAKKTTRQGKIANNEAKISRLSTKAERLSVTNEMLHRLTAGTRLEAAANAIIEQDQRRIDKIRNTSIPRCGQKIAGHQARIAQLDKRIAAQQRKIDKCTALSNVITSFVIMNPEKRRAQFSQNMDVLHRVTTEALQAKLEKCNTRHEALIAKLQDEKTTPAQAERIWDKIFKINERSADISQKLSVLTAVTQPYAEQPAEQQDFVLKHTEQQLDTAAQRGDTRINPLTETICMSAAERVIDRDAIQAEATERVSAMSPDEKREFMNRADSDRLHTPTPVEIAMHDIINAEERAAAQTRAAAEQAAPIVTEQQPSVLVRAQDENTKINPEYFTSIPKGDRQITTMPSDAAKQVMETLKQQGIPFSAVVRENNLTTVTVNKAQHGAVFLNALHAAGQMLPQKAAQRQPDKTVRPPEAAAKISAALDAAGIAHRSVQQDQGTVILTNPQDREKVNAVISATEQHHRRQFINPEVYAEMPREERFTQRMPEDQARAAVDQLAAQGVPHSAVLDGDRSAVTVSQKSKGFVLSRQKRAEIAGKAAQAQHKPAKKDAQAQQQDISD